jgi:protein gp37
VADRSAIEWTTATWNPTTGCDRISAGCDNCYALALARRLKAMGQPKYQNDGDPRTSGPGFAVTVHPDALSIPRRWREPRLVFVDSMSDLFHARVPRGFVGEVFEVMASTPRHTYQVLTKRPRRLRHLAGELTWAPNVWIGVSVESPEQLCRIQDLRAVPAAVRFLSCEPLLAPLRDVDLTGIGWVIAGGESGRAYRPVGADWVRELRDACGRQSVPFFFKLLCTNRCLVGHRAMACSAVAAAAVAVAPGCGGLGRAAVTQPLRSSGEGSGGCQRRVVPGYGLFLDDVHPAVDFRVTADGDLRADLPRRAAFSAQLRAEDAGVEFGDEGDVGSLGAPEQVGNTLQPVILQSAACPARRHPEVVGEPSHVRISCGQGLQHLRRVAQLREHPADVTVGQRDRLHGIKCGPRRSDGQSHPAPRAAWSRP